MSSIKLFLSVRDRAKQTAECFGGLLRSSKGLADIYVYDNASKPELGHLMGMYHRMLVNNEIAGLIANTPSGMEDVYWSKNFAWAQFIAMMKLLPAHQCQYIVMADNDIAIGGNWIRACLNILNDPISKKHNVTVVSPYDGPPIYDTKEKIEVEGYPCDLRNALTSRFWFAKATWWFGMDTPPWTKIIRDGKPDRYPTDNWYYEQMQKKNEWFAVINPPIVTDPTTPWPSARMGNNIGADCR